MPKSRKEHSKSFWIYVKTYIIPILLSAIIAWLVADIHTCNAEKKNEEVKLIVRLEEKKSTPQTSSVVITEEGKALGIKSLVGTFELISSEKIPLITITNKGKKPVGISDVFLMLYSGKKTQWDQGWVDPSGDTLLKSPFYLKPDTSLRLTCRTAIDTVYVDLHNIYIQLTETGEVKQYALKWENP